MPTIDQIADTGIFSEGPDGSFRRQFVPVNEELTAQYFADEINSGRLSVRDAWDQYWSYEEDAGLWDLPKDGDWRALLPSWYSINCILFFFLTEKNQIDFLDVVRGTFRRAECALSPNRYNPFLANFIFINYLLNGEREACDKYVVPMQNIFVQYVNFINKSGSLDLKAPRSMQSNAYTLFQDKPYSPDMLDILLEADNNKKWYGLRALVDLLPEKNISAREILKHVKMRFGLTHDPDGAIYYFIDILHCSLEPLGYYPDKKCLLE